MLRKVIFEMGDPMKTSVLFFSLSFSSLGMADEPQSSAEEPEGEVGELPGTESEDEKASEVERPEPVPLPPAPPPVVPVEALPEKVTGFGQTRFFGDFRFAAVMQRLDAIDSRVTYLEPSLVVAMPRADARWESTWTKGVDTTLGVRLISGVSPEEKLRFIPWDASMRIAASPRLALRVGWMEPSFGLPEHYGLQEFYLAGIDQFEPLSWQVNMSTERELAASLEFSWGDRIGMDVQIGEGRGGGARRLRNRVSALLPGGVAVYLSEQTEVGAGESVLAFSESEMGVGLVVRRGSIQAMGEYLRDLQLSGGQAWQSVFSYTLVTPRTPWDNVEVVGRIRSVDPHLLRENDRRRYVALGSNFGFLMPDEDVWLWSALWEMDVPEDQEAAIEHEIVLQLGIRL